MKLPTVKEAMSSTLISCGVDCTVEDVSKMMVEKNIRSIVIENKIGNPVGIVTGGDIVKSVAKNLGPETKVDDIIGKKFITIDAEEDIIDAAHIMNEKDIKRLIVTEKGKMSGILTVNDVLKYSPTYLNEFSKTLDKLDKIIKRL